MQQKGAAEMAHDWRQQAEGAAQHILIPAAITAACSAIVQYIRIWLSKRQARAAVPSTVADIRQMMSPDDPGKDDLRTIVEQTRAEQMAQKILIGSLTARFDSNLSLQADRHAELKALLQTR